MSEKVVPSGLKIRIFWVEVEIVAVTCSIRGSRLRLKSSISCSNFTFSEKGNSEIGSSGSYNFLFCLNGESAKLDTFPCEAC